MAMTHSKSREHSTLEGEVRRGHNQMDQDVGGSESEELGLQFRRVGPRSGRKAVAPFALFHLCGAYQRNCARRYGLMDEQEKSDEENVALMKAANEQIARRMKEQF